MVQGQCVSIGANATDTDHTSPCNIRLTSSTPLFHGTQTVASPTCSHNNAHSTPDPRILHLGCIVSKSHSTIPCMSCDALALLQGATEAPMQLPAPAAEEAPLSHPGLCAADLEALNAENLTASAAAQQKLAFLRLVGNAQQLPPDLVALHLLVAACDPTEAVRLPCCRQSLSASSRNQSNINQPASCRLCMCPGVHRSRHTFS